jgi:ATP-dependent helicase HrpB
MTVAPPAFPRLPILDALPALRSALDAQACAVLEAPPGAGKSTVVPLALLDAPWRQGDARILVLEPRRIAARAIAQRMADIRGEALGETVGFRTRLDSRVGPRTRIEVLTEGILTRRLQSDATLEGVACVIFDEFHERNLQGDLGLALALEVQRTLREDLRLLVMSATLDGAALARLLGEGTPIVSSPGRMFEVATHYLPPPPAGAQAREPRIEARVVAALRRALLEQAAGDALVFLPGAPEIRRCAELLAAEPAARDCAVLPLYGELAAAEQDAALRPDPQGRRKLVLATNLAETSLTIDGVRIVVDSGLERRPRFDPGSGMSRLETLRISQASAAQRRGRAGRTAPGACYRLWSESQQDALRVQTPPEILETDLAPLALELACWGTPPETLAWLDPPPVATLAQARELLTRLEALDDAGRATAIGRRMVALGIHPRLAHLLLRARELGLGELGCALAALLGERDVLRGPAALRDPDLRPRAELLLRETSAPPPGLELDRGALQQARRSAELLQRRLGHEPQPPTSGAAPIEPVGLLLALAYPDRIGRARTGESGRYLLSGGRGASFADPCSLAGSEWIAVAALDAGEREARIQLAAPLALADLEQHFKAAIEPFERVAWDARSGAVVAERGRRLGALEIERLPWREAPPERLQAAMLEGLRELGLTALPWTRELEQWRARVGFLRAQSVDGTAAWPDLSDAALLADLADWLGPWLAGVTRREHLARVRLAEALHARLDHAGRRRLDEFAPTHLVVPSGSRLAIDYSSGVPELSVRLQEVFGLAATPRVAGGRVPVTMQLLSPAGRPVQRTQDLASFWSRGYADVRKDLRGRYPKHHWPEDPHTAVATRRVRPDRSG